MEGLRQNTVESQDLQGIEGVFLSGGIANEVEEELEEGSLVGGLGVLALEPVEDLQDGLSRVFEVQNAVVGGD